MYSDHSMATLSNSIVWGNSPDQISSELCTVVVNYSDVHGGYPGENNLASDPLFVDPGNGDFHLQPGSPCIDAGSNAAPNLPNHDFEGDDRVVDGDLDGATRVDMGVDEALPQSVFCRWWSGITRWGEGVGLPWACRLSNVARHPQMPAG